MHQYNEDLILSATDLAAFLGCRHRTALDMAAARGLRSRPKFDDPLIELLWKRGAEHEKAYVDELRADHDVIDLSDAHRDERCADTIAAMQRGVGIIVQGELRDGVWLGKPDILRRIDAPSAFGAWSYMVEDTKLATETKAGTILQLGLYTEMLALVQGARPETFVVRTPVATETYRVDDYAAYFRLIRKHMQDAVAKSPESLADENYPEPVDHCDICAWIRECRDRRRTDDHLSLVAGISRGQRRELESRDIPTLTALAELPASIGFKPTRGSVESYVRIREQARLQAKARTIPPPPPHQMLAVEAERGLCRLPEPSPGDLFLDLEGDPLAGDAGREYLFGLVDVSGTYHARWAFTDADERDGFEWVMDMIAERVREHPGMHVYHYAPYEQTAFKRLMGCYATRERELDAMLRESRFVDLYAVVRQSLQAGIDRYSIKSLEPLYGFPRDVDLREASKGLRAMEYALQAGIVSALPKGVLDTVEGYNKDDCVSTLKLRDWLESLREGTVKAGTEIPRPVATPAEAPPNVDAKAQQVESMRARLLDGLPPEKPDRTAEQQGRWLLAYLLDYHRREDKATWWDYFRLRELPPEDLFDERYAIAGMTFVERVDVIRHKKTQKPTGSVIDRYSYPAQEMEVDAKDELKLQSGEKWATVVAVDREARTIDVNKGPSRADQHPSEVFAFSYVPSDAMADALMRLGESVATDATGLDAAKSLLAGSPPRLVQGQFLRNSDESEVDFAVRIAGDLDRTVLAIQGPPGAGKTYCGSHIICELVRQGKKVGVTANSHSVIRNLLDAVAESAIERGEQVAIGHKANDDAEVTRHIQNFAGNVDTLAALTSGIVNVVGGTAWVWARPDFADTVDVLVVDEAGQMSLANVLAVSQAAKSVVLLGDPQQLEQPRKGSHPDGVGVSALQHLLGDHQTIPPDRGLFLPTTWRLEPGICAFTSEVFYERRLHPRSGLERQCLQEIEPLPLRGLVFSEIVHDGNRNYSEEEVDHVDQLIDRILHSGASWTDREGTVARITPDDILVVSPYNSQVNRLIHRLSPRGTRVGTVDKFQGREAPIVIYSMATSRPEDAPRGMEFLYSLNRLNVATSRAKCLAILVASPRLFDVECHSPRQMKLANALCRFRELATPITV